MLKKTNNRASRIAEKIKRELAVIIQREFKDTRVKFVTVNAVKMSTDLRYAKVYFTHLSEDLEPQAATKILNDAVGFFRSRLAEQSNIKSVPSITFIYDETMVRAERIRKLLNEEDKD